MTPFLRSVAIQRDIFLTIVGRLMISFFDRRPFNDPFFSDRWPFNDPKCRLTIQIL